MAANVKPLRPPKPAATWLDALARKKNGEPYGDERNVKIALMQAPELKDALQYNEFHDRIELSRKLPWMDLTEDEEMFGEGTGPFEWTDECLSELTVWLQEQAFPSLRKNIVQDTVIMVAKRAGYHPVREYLLEARKNWDGKPRLDGWLKKYLGAKDHVAYLETVGPKFLIGAVARIMEPGCKMDNILVLEGAQGKGKSTAVEVLAKGWSHDVTGDLASKDAAILIRGTWLAELGELAAVKRTEQESIKGFISRRVDHYRPPYGRNAVDSARQTVFLATTNENDYLQDPTGARRFWPVECSTIDMPALRADVDQLWGEAAQRHVDREPWHLDEVGARRAAIEQRARQKVSPVDELVMEYAEAERIAGRTTLEMRGILQFCFDVDTKEDPQKAGGLARQISAALVREGWKKLKPVGRGVKRRQCYQWDPACDLDAAMGDDGCASNVAAES